jgi:restriction endonuclease Mrr
MVKPHLSPVDEERLPSGNGYRWHRKANWERYYMVREGLLRDDSPQGIWELTETGWREAKKLIAGETQEQ